MTPTLSGDVAEAMVTVARHLLAQDGPKPSLRATLPGGYRITATLEAPSAAQDALPALAGLPGVQEPQTPAQEPQSPATPRWSSPMTCSAS